MQMKYEEILKGIGRLEALVETNGTLNAQRFDHTDKNIGALTEQVKKLNGSVGCNTTKLSTHDTAIALLIKENETQNKDADEERARQKSNWDKVWSTAIAPVLQTLMAAGLALLGLSKLSQ